MRLVVQEHTGQLCQVNSWKTDLYKIIVSIYSFIFFLVIESHPDNALEDLRLDQQFAELKDHVKSYNLDNMDKKVCALFSCICLHFFFTEWTQYFYIQFFFPAGSQSHTMDYHCCQIPREMA